MTRWLDDVGLPQYKDAFLEARIDGRMLNFLTVDDLFQLKVTNQLHHLSIRRGIQVLRENNFEPSCLKRRGAPGERDSQIVHSDVVFWTNHRWGGEKIKNSGPHIMFQSDGVAQAC